MSSHSLGHSLGHSPGHSPSHYTPGQYTPGYCRYLATLSQVAMPFYLTHQQVSHKLVLITITTILAISSYLKLIHSWPQPISQVLVALLSGALWVPYLSLFPTTLLLATLVTGTLAFTITKLGPLRYTILVNYVLYGPSKTPLPPNPRMEVVISL